MMFNNYEQSIINSLKKIGISKVIAIRNSKYDFLTNDFEVFFIEDARTAGYIATGMSVESSETIFIAIGDNNEFKSLAPAITEAFYRNIQILVGVFRFNKYFVDLKKDFKDTFKVIEHCYNEKEVLEKINKFDDGNLSLPGMIVFDFEMMNIDSNVIEVDKNLLNIYNENDFLLLSHNINYDFEIKPKLYINNGAGGYDGTLSILLGAALSRKYGRYIALILESELIHDLNTLGNRHFPSNIIINVISQKKGYKNTIKDFANSLDIIFYDYGGLVANYSKSAIVWIEE